jgi:hypothetical protein
VGTGMASMLTWQGWLGERMCQLQLPIILQWQLTELTFKTRQAKLILRCLVIGKIPNNINKDIYEAQ